VGVSVGGSIEGWQVTRVEPDEVGMRSAAGEQEIKLAASKPSGQPAVQAVGGPGSYNLNAAQANANAAQANAQARFQANMAARNNAANNNANVNANNNANNDDDDDNN
jgi:hypothetical protein